MYLTLTDIVLLTSIIQSLMYRNFQLRGKYLAA